MIFGPYCLYWGLLSLSGSTLRVAVAQNDSATNAKKSGLTRDCDSRLDSEKEPDSGSRLLETRDSRLAIRVVHSPEWVNATFRIYASRVLFCAIVAV